MSLPLWRVVDDFLRKLCVGVLTLSPQLWTRNAEQFLSAFKMAVPGGDHLSTVAPSVDVPQVPLEDVEGLSRVASDA